MCVSYKLDEVARSICSSKALLVEDPNQPAMVLLRLLWIGGWLVLFVQGC